MTHKLPPIHADKKPVDYNDADRPKYRDTSPTKVSIDKPVFDMTISIIMNKVILSLDKETKEILSKLGVSDEIVELCLNKLKNDIKYK